MTKKLVYYSVLLVALALLQGCDILNTSHDVEVVNYSKTGSSVYLDNEYQFYLGPGESKTIKNVEEGSHILTATTNGWISCDDTIYVDSDVSYSIYDV